MAKVTGISDFEQHIVGERVIDPIAWEQLYGLKFGSAFGLAHGLDQLSLFRPANKDTTVSGLYFTGASTRPGNGVPLCFISAKLCAERIMHDLHASP
jgi:phytoene desaturase (3,4-didehydrolycopene-forming)